MATGLQKHDPSTPSVVLEEVATVQQTRDSSTLSFAPQDEMRRKPAMASGLTPALASGGACVKRPFGAAHTLAAGTALAADVGFLGAAACGQVHTSLAIGVDHTVADPDV